MSDRPDAVITNMNQISSVSNGLTKRNPNGGYETENALTNQSTTSTTENKNSKRPKSKKILKYKFSKDIWLNFD